MTRFLLVLLFTVIAQGCDDSSSNNIHDAGPDGDVQDIVDVVDADGGDGDVDAIEWPGCTPWYSQESVPEAAISRFPTPDGYRGEIDWQISGFSKEVFALAYQPQIYQGGTWIYLPGEIWIWNLDTLDATLTSDASLMGGYRPSIYENHLLSHAGNGTPEMPWGMYYRDLDSEGWSLIGQTSTDGTVVYFTEPVAGPDYAWTTRVQYVEDGTLLIFTCRLYQYNYAEETFHPVHEDSYWSCESRFDIGEQYTAYCGYSEASEKLQLHVANGSQPWVIPTERFNGYQCGGVFVRDHRVLVYAYRNVNIRYNGQVFVRRDYNQYIYNIQEDTVQPVKDEPLWDQFSSDFSWPIIAYRDHAVACWGDNDTNGDYSTGTLMIKNLETGVERPIPYPGGVSSYEDLYRVYPILVLNNPWRVLIANYGNSNHQPTVQGELLLIDLEAAEYIEPNGTIIPDPTFPDGINATGNGVRQRVDSSLLAP